MKECFIFRVDADSSIGIGHLMRCLTLANKLSDFGFITAFICKKNTDLYKNFITNSGSLYFSIQDQPDNLSISTEYYDAKETLSICRNFDVVALIVDSYNLGLNWELEIRRTINKVIVIDDLANRDHDCFILLDSTLDRRSDEYINQVNADAKILTNSKFCILREEFYHLKDRAIEKRSKTKEIGSILLNFGGSDPMMHTVLIYGLIRELDAFIKIKIIISKACKSLNNILKISDNDKHVEVYVDTDEVAEIMLNSDLSIGALGTTSWERCCLGLPSIALISAENQRHNASLLNEKKTIILSNESDFKRDLKRIIENRDGMEVWRNMVSACFNICDGKGVYRVCREILKFSFSLVDFVMKDSQDLYDWQLEGTARLFSRNKQKPEIKEHQKWVEESLRDSQRRMWILKVKGINAGYVRLDDIGNIEEVSILISEKFRNIGLASFAIREVKNRSKYNLVLAYVDSNNIDSINLFLRSGFREIIDNNYLWES